ncbi:penicillin-binding protein [Candidatus Collierbacteria bacterium CG10_big_fil_rev_8_21_14_0_10_44_9]|uniref:Penicillin-binding protein n=1 Tax=Candidatus Collierbacteria bacterium CG10_big_fil_rev_8_21_14_0_10_44_9 TaxID=1974535 RepID=A0A2H0VIV4_9BACT|nr:MAG: penicillin-binding protein [Candidatus Collierbacteria bacterium CG10_big_fil_rev_8_21_14_0_10_44_9]
MSKNNFLSILQSKLQKKAISGTYSKKTIVIIGVSISLVLGLLFIFLKDLPSPTNLNKPNAYPISTKILDRNGNLLYEIYDNQNRTPIKLDDLPQYLKQATIAIEDKNFYRHHGFDTGGLIRAGWKTLTGQRLEGGSTITQQLVKVALLTPERTISRKIKEAILTVATEILYSKNQILEMYLNHIPYGGTAYGIEAAAHRFFDKNASDLTLSESALLVGLPQAPSRYSPFGNPDSARDRQSLVLGRMVEDKYLTSEVATAAKNEELHYADAGVDISAPHFVMYVRQILEEKYGVQVVEQGGLQVTTTLDLDLQNAAQASLSAELTTLKKLKISNGAALVSNPSTGEILAMIGSKDYFSEGIDGKVNVTTRLRQPGSSIKPLNYALGLETKVITPSTMLLDTPICFSVPGQVDYCPKNYDNSFRGLTQIRFALGNSYNIPAVKVLSLNSVEGFISFARKMGITSWTDPSLYGLSLTLGGGEVTMLDMATAFGVFANQGIKVPLHSVLKVVDSAGIVLEEYVPADGIRNGAKVLSEETAFLISHILSDNNARSGAFGTNSVLNVPGKTVSVKTGTTNNLRDNWTIGYTPTLLVATWVGNNDNSPMSYVASGMTGASPIWQKIMKYGLRDIKTEGLVKPESIEGASVCSNSGTLPTPENPCDTRYEYFLPGTIPTESKITQRELFVNKTTHHPPNNEAEFSDVEPRMQTVASDPFIKDYCIDCEPYPDGYQETPITIPAQ